MVTPGASKVSAAVDGNNVTPGEDVARDSILLAAYDAFAERGFHGTTIREISRGCGLSVPGIYHHFPSKEAILATAVRRTMDDLIEVVAASVERERTPLEKLDAFVRTYVLYHTERQIESFVANAELRGLSEGQRAEIVGKRDDLEAMLRTIVTSGMNAGVFRVTWPAEVCRAIFGMCTAVAAWFRPSGGSLSGSEVAERYVAIVRDCLNARTR